MDGRGLPTYSFDVQVYRGSETEATRLMRLLEHEGLPATIERYGRDTAYVVVRSTRPDIPRLAKSAGKTVRRVSTLAELQAAEPPH